VRYWSKIADCNLHNLYLVLLLGATLGILPRSLALENYNPWAIIRHDPASILLTKALIHNKVT